MKIPQRLVIQDEIQHRLIAAIFAHEIAKYLVFHGGTMLRVCGMSDYRYSEDLDILLVGLSKEDFYSVLEKILPDVSKQTKAKLTISWDNYSIIDYIVWEFRGEIETIGLDIKTVEEIENLDIKTFKIQQNHKGLSKSLDVPCYSIAQVLASKFGCVSDRTEGRDVYDIWYLSKDEETMKKAWDLHSKAFHTKPCKILPEDTAQHLEDNKVKFVSALSFDMAHLAIPVDIPPETILETVISRCLLLPSMRPIKQNT